MEERFQFDPDEKERALKLLGELVLMLHGKRITDRDIRMRVWEVTEHMKKPFPQKF